MMEYFEFVSGLRVTTLLAALFFMYLVLCCIYRLTFHPLAKFPGPKLAAITSLWAAYYDLRKNPSLAKKLPALHDKYGPIVRTFPNELHIRDSDAYSQVFKIATKFDKHAEFYDQNPFMQGSFFNQPDLKSAKPHRDMFQPYFSKASVHRIEHLIQEQETKFLNDLQKAAKEQRVLNLTLGFKALTADVIMTYSYQKTFGALDAPEFRFRPLLELEKFIFVAPFITHFPKPFKFINAISPQLPSSIVEKYFGAFAAGLWITSQITERLRTLQARSKADVKEAPVPTIFDTILYPDLSKGQFTPSEHDLVADAFLIFGAGTDTTANILALGTYHILRNPRILKKFQTELREAIPNKDDMVSWAQLETLPYLTAVVKESLRFGHGAPGRLPRVVPPTGATLCGQYIPPGTIISLGHYAYHNDPSVFPNPEAFQPERWLNLSSSEASKLDKGLVAFSRGSRSCLGLNLAYAELYLTFAHLFRRFEMRLEGMKEGDMEWYDTFTLTTKGALKLSFEEMKD